MSKEAANKSFLSTPLGQFLLALVVHAALMGFLFSGSFDEEKIMFSNDGPLGANVAAQARLPEIFNGAWADLNWVGNAAGSALPSLTYSLLYLIGPLGYAKFYAPLALLVLGLSSWLFFWRCRFHHAVCLIASVAVALNMNVFSNSCWGLASRATMLASIFFALAMFPRQEMRWQIPRLILSGFGVGMGIMEGYDIGAIYSLYVAAFAVFVGLTAPGETIKRTVKAIGNAAIIAVAAGFMAAAGLVTLIQTQIQGAGGGASQENAPQAQGWDWATQWSLPKVETIRVIIPGLFGYRMDGGDGSNYWGTVGQQPGWNDHHQGFPRHSGSGEYAGILVVLVAVWGLSQTFRKTGCPYSQADKRLIWFWAGAAVVSLLFAFGRHAPFYRLIYALPYFSTIRNPIKFMHPFQLAVGILFAYGLNGLAQRYLTGATPRSGSIFELLRGLFKGSPSNERRWAFGSCAAIAISLVGWLIFASSRSELSKFLQSTGFAENQAAAILKFSNGEFGWYLLFLTLSVAGLIVILSGAFSAKRAKVAWIFLWILVVTDLVRANQPWMFYLDYKQQYASNLVIDALKEKPYEQRVTTPPFLVPDQLKFFRDICNSWLQHQFQYYNIQSIEIIQMPRGIPADVKALNQTFGQPALQPRLWELTNTRYILAALPFLEAMNRDMDPLQRRFKVHTPFELFQEKQGGPILARTNAQGPFGIIEFTGALPRAHLCQNWIAITNEQQTLNTLADTTNFNPHTSVVVSKALPIQPQPTGMSANTGIATIAKYAPKRIELAVQLARPSVLLLNNKYDPHWKVTVDGKSAELLKCNYLMQGVLLETGNKSVVFSFEPPTFGLKVSVAALILGAVLICLLSVAPGKPANAS